MSIRIGYLADHERHLAQVARWQHAQFGYLNPADTLEQRAGRLRDALHRDRLPMALIAVRRMNSSSGRRAFSRPR